MVFGLHQGGKASTFGSCSGATAWCLISLADAKAGIESTEPDTTCFVVSTETRGTS